MKQIKQLQNNKLSKPKNEQNINQVYSLLNRQQQAIATLLNKYSDIPSSQNNKIDKYTSLNMNQGFHQSYIKPQSQTIDNSASSIKLKLLLAKDQKSFTRQSSPNQRSRVTNQYSELQRGHDFQDKSQRIIRSRNQSINLPIIYQRNKLVKSNNKKIKNRNQFMVEFLRDRKKMQHNLYKIYGYTEHFNNQNNNDIKSGSKVTQIQNIPKRKIKKPKNKKKEQNRINSSFQLPQPDQDQNQLIQFNQNSTSMNKIQSDDQSSHQQIPTKYYEKQFRGLMRGQCLQQINFLYFSRNQQMKDWTDNLLSMIQKHDKQITSLKMKSKYLEKFDDQFFSIGIFNSDQI